MIQKLTITILVDNNSVNPQLASEHGLSIWIEADDFRFLFDTGQSDSLIQNAEMLGIDLSTADALVLSHGHYDHTGGIVEVLNLNPGITVYCHPGVFVPRYSRQPDGTMKPVGMTPEASDALHKKNNFLHWVSGPTLISADIGITSQVPRITAFEDTGGAFYLDAEAMLPDMIDDDLAMWIRTESGIVIITGCCHSGLVNTLKYIEKLSDVSEIHTVIGGFHLLHASPERMKKTCDYLQSKKIARLVSCHCTGENAAKYLQKQCGEKLVSGAVGKKLSVSCQ